MNSDFRYCDDLEKGENPAGSIGSGECAVSWKAVWMGAGRG